MRIKDGAVPPGTVRAVLAQYLEACEAAGEEPVSETHSFYQLMEKRIPLDTGELPVWTKMRAAERLRVQVLRELNLLAAKGVLVKRGDRRDLRFYTPAAAKAADEREEDRQHAAETVRSATFRARNRLQALGFDPLIGSGADIRLDLDDWVLLLKMAEQVSSANPANKNRKG